MQPEQGEAFSIAYDRLVAADGARSHVLDDLVQDAGLQCDRDYTPDACKSVSLPRSNPALGLELEPDKIHGWNLSTQTRMLMVPQPGDRLNGVIIFDARYNPFLNFSTKAEVSTFFHFSIGGKIDLFNSNASIGYPKTRSRHYCNYEYQISRTNSVSLSICNLAIAS